MKHKIFGISFSKAPERADRVLDIVRDCDDEVILATKKTYSHKEPRFNFKYKYVAKAVNLYEYTGEKKDEGKWGVELLLCVTPDSLLSNHLSDVAELEDLDEDDVGISDLVRQGVGCVSLAHEKVYVGDKYDEVMPAVYDKIATVVDTVDALRGIYLDKVVNKIGTTGWDILNTYVGDGTDFIKATFDRKE